MKKSLPFGVLACVSMILVACGGGEEETAGDDEAEKVNLTFATTNDDTGITASMREYFDERITELSDGSIEMEFFMGGQLGGENEQLEQMEAGEVDIGMAVLHANNYYPEYNAINVPFLFKDFEKMKKFMDDEMRAEINEVAVEEGGIRTLGMQSYGSRWVTSNQPFSNPSELEGLKIRMPEMETWIPVWEELGALPTPISANEIVTALQTGTIDAQENTLNNIVGRQMWEYQDYAVNVGHIEAVYDFLVSEQTWQNKLNESQQEALEEAVQDTVNYIGDVVEKENEKFVDRLEEEGMEIIEVDQEEFREAAEPATKQVVESMLAPGLQENIEEANQD